MSKYDEKAAEALRQAKQATACQHRPENRSIDLETADQFCGDCGMVTEAYVDGMPGRFPGRQASDLITEQLKREFPDQMVATHLHYVEPVAGGEEFNVLMEIQARAGGGFRQYRLVRHGVTVSATLMGKP